MKRRHGISRRDFIRTGMAAGTALALPPGASSEEEAPRTARVGVVGVGSRGSFLVNTLLAIPGVEVRAVCDVAPDRAASAQGAVEAKTGKRPEAYTNGDHDFENLAARDDLDAVITATPWDWHTPVMVAAMKAGKFGGTEMPAALTLDDCRLLVKTSEETGMPCMLLENVCYFQNVLSVLRMVREGLFGTMLHCEAGYQHDCRYLAFTPEGQLTWRGKQMAEKNGNLYPTHPFGPVAWWLNINRGDRCVSLVSASTAAIGLKEYAKQTFGPDHELAKRDYALGDVNTTLIKTANGATVTLYFDLCTYRPYDLIFRVQGTKGIYLGSRESVCIEGVTPGKEVWEPFAPYLDKYAHPLWANLEAEAVKNGGHGGGDYITLFEFIKAVRNRTQTPQDVYDAATWSAIVPLSMASVAQGTLPVEFPDFTGGRWKTSPPVGITGASHVERKL